MGMFNFVLDSFKGEIFDFKVKWQGLIAGLNVFKIVLVDFIMFSKNFLRFFIFDLG